MVTAFDRSRDLPIIEGIAIAMLLLALMPHNPYLYYNILRIVICCISLYLVFRLYKQGLKQWILPFVITAVIYNPLIHVTLTRNIWLLINVATIILFVMIIVISKNKIRTLSANNQNTAKSEVIPQQAASSNIPQSANANESTLDNNSTSDLLNLASRIYGRPVSRDSHKLDELLAGLRSEQYRLGKHKYAVILEQKDYEYDGLVEMVKLISGFNTQKDASKCVDISAQKLLDTTTSRIDPDGNHWKLELTSEVPNLFNPLPNCPLHTIHEKAYKVVADSYTSRYIRFRAIGPFDAFIVGNLLFDFINPPYLLMNHFRNVGESLSSNQPRRRLN